MIAGNSRTLLCLPLKSDFRLPFTDTGSLVNARVMRDKQTGVSQGFAFLEFTSRPAASQVLNQYDGKHIHSNLVLRLNWAAYGLGHSSEGEHHLPQVLDLSSVQDLYLILHPSVRRIHQGGSLPARSMMVAYAAIQACPG